MRDKFKYSSFVLFFGLVFILIINVLFSYNSGNNIISNYGFDRKYEIQKDSGGNLYFETSQKIGNAYLTSNDVSNSKIDYESSDYKDLYDSKYVGAMIKKDESYSNSDYFANYYLIDDEKEEKGMITETSGSSLKNFNDNDSTLDSNNGNEMEYYKYLNIVLSPNIMSTDLSSLKISFSTYDLTYCIDTFDGDSYRLHDTNKLDDKHENKPVGYLADDVITDLKLSTDLYGNYLDTDFDSLKITTSNDRQNSINDLEKYDEDDGMFDSNDYKSRTVNFRSTYKDNPIGESDIITIWTNAPSNVRYEEDRGNKNFFKPVRFKDENFIPLTVEGIFYIDSYDASEFRIDESIFMQALSESILNNINDKYYEIYNYDSNGFNEISDYDGNPDTPNTIEDSYDKISFSYDNVTYNDLIQLLFGFGESDSIFEQSLYSNSGSTIGQEYFQFNFDTLNNDNNGDSNNKNDNFSVYGHDLSLDNSGIINENIKSSALTFTIKRNEIYESYYKGIEYYNGEEIEVPFGVYNADEINKGNNTISLNLPFYHWEINTIPKWVNEETSNLETMFKNDASFKILVSDDFAKKDIYIDIVTNTNLNFSIYDDSNIYSISKDGKVLPSNGSETNSWNFQTNFEDSDNGLDEYQEEDLIITYKQKINDSDTTSKLTQKMHVNIKYDGDSVISNNSTSQTVEMVGDEQSPITSTPIAVSKNKEDLFDENGDYEIVDYYEARSDFTWFLNEEQYSLIYKNLDYEKYYKNGEELDKTILNLDTSEQMTIYGDTNGSLLHIDLKHQNNVSYDYWINISEQFIDYDESGETKSSSHNHIPSEWKDLIGTIINYDEENEIYSIEYEGSIYYLKNYFDTPRGDLFEEKGIKKGWAYSDIYSLQSYMIESLELNWDTLIRFSELVIDEERVSNSTKELRSKEHIKFEQLQKIWDEEIEQQLLQEELQSVNALVESDFKIEYYYGEDEVSIPENLIIYPNTKIVVKVTSTKYGKGIGDYEFSFYPTMIEPLPLWLKIIIAFIVVFILIGIFLVSYGTYSRKKNSKILE